MPKIKSLHFTLLLAFIFGAFACKKNFPAPPYEATKSMVSDSAMVVSAHPLATTAGVDILRKGGNAIDAAIAVQFALAVVYPRAGNIGGGGFLVYRSNTGQTAALDYREKAPQKAGRDMYLDEQGNVIENMSTLGHWAVGVPGTVAGMVAAHEKYGKLPMETLLAPAIELAKNGFGITEQEANRLNEFQEAFKKVNDKPNAFIRPNWKAGDLLVQSQLAKTLERIRDLGMAGFYEGQTAQKIVDEIQSGGGIISLQDLKDYRAVWRDPIIETYKNYKIISMPPPSSGGVALAQLLKMIEPYPIELLGFHSKETIHLMAEAERRVYSDRAKHLGDIDFYEVPMEQLLDSFYLAGRMSDFSMDSATISNTVNAGNFNMLKESFETTHTSIVDREGNATSVTTTLNSNYGSKVVVDGAGFFLNNEMDDFSIKPGVPNQFGLLGAEANAIQPGKRMLSSMTPTIFEKNGKLFMVAGTPGGSTIITAVFQVFVNVAEFHMPLDQAIEAKRFHHQWLPDEILIEEGSLTDQQKSDLAALGHQFREVKYMAIVKAIQVLDNGRLQGCGDPRNPDDTAKGY
ncbi:MAG: gamma-glutamyltransferase [Saprospiraceae bacterium]|nr:gamma-glutamyltransferase [Saprospiraceae bacterium]MCB9325554.1 gamma-glutamyltransferase [Lewinellaceae bacterium]